MGRLIESVPADVAYAPEGPYALSLRAQQLARHRGISAEDPRIQAIHEALQRLFDVGGDATTRAELMHTRDKYLTALREFIAAAETHADVAVAAA